VILRFYSTLHIVVAVSIIADILENISLVINE